MTYTNPSFVERASDVFSVRHRKAPQTWGSAFGAGFTYTARQPSTNPPFLERGGWKTKNGAGGSVFLVKFKLFWF